MHQLKDIAALMDNACTRTAKRWWKKLDSMQERLKRPRVKPDVTGHGPHRWEDATAALLIKLWKTYHTAHGTTPQIVKAKAAGTFTDSKQMSLNFPECNAVKKSSRGLLPKAACE